MAFLGTPPVADEREWINLPDDVYEALVGEVEEVPNMHYNPDTDPENKKTQIQWTFFVRQSEVPTAPEGKRYGTRPRAWTGSALGRHPRNKLVGYLKVIDPTFDLEQGYQDMQELINRVVGMPVRITLKTPEGKSFPKIEGVLASRMGAPEFQELVALGIVKTEGDPF